MDPLRQCAACRQKFVRSELIRLIHNRLDEQIVCHFPGTSYPSVASGRSAYCCASEACLKAALKGNKLQKTLKTRIPGDILGRLEYWAKGQNTCDGIQSTNL